MSAIPSTFALNDIPSQAQWNSWGLALQGLGITDDNGGFPIILTAIPGLAIPIGSAHEVGKSVANGSYVVPSGKLFVITNYLHGVSVNDTITPSGGSAFIIGAAGVVITSAPTLVLGAGDTVAMGSTSVCSGILFDAPAGVSRVLQTVSNTVTYSVPALRRFLLTAAAAPQGSGYGVFLSIDGTNGVPAASLDSSAGASNSPSGNVVKPLLLGAGQSLASNSATLVLVSGFLFTAAN